MEYVTATSDMINAVYNVLHTAIETIYPKYYPNEVVDFFCRYHSKEHIWDGIASGNMGVLICDNTIVGTGCFEGNRITSVYVLPAACLYEHRGYKTVGHGIFGLDNDVKLVYEIMEKKLRQS